MKILVFGTQLTQLGGAERLGVELAEALSCRKDMHVDILGMYAPQGPADKQIAASLLARGIGAVRYLSMTVHPSVARTIGEIIKLRRLLQSQKYDIVETTMMGPAAMACWARLWNLLCSIKKTR